jgi:DNA-binding MarR family transcriptional regulator
MPKTRETAEELLKCFLVLSRTIDHVLEARAVEMAVREPLSSSKIRILGLLGHRGGHRASDVAKFLGVTKPAVTQIIDTMIRSRLVRRKPGEQDYREVFLELTDRGKRVFRTLRSRQRHLIRVALTRAQRREAQPWIGALREMTQALAQADDTVTEYCLQCGAHADGTCILEGGDACCRFLQPGFHPQEKTAGKRGRGRRTPRRA